jgi:hypothetical protein
MCPCGWHLDPTTGARDDCWHQRVDPITDSVIEPEPTTDTGETFDQFLDRVFA